MTFALTDIIATIAALLVFLTFSMKTMVPLRLVGIASNVFFIAYGYLQPAYPLLVLHALLLPLNILRLRQMLLMVRQVEDAAKGDLNMDWLKPFTTKMTLAAGDMLFRKGDQADAIFFVMSGTLRIPEIGVTIAPGQIVGELGFLSPNKARTQSVACAEPAEVLKISYDQVRQLYFQNPKFGFFFLQLASRRLFENNERLERDLAHCRAAAQTA
ncbi:MAG: Crp/Fnr family transcriptional regulator [Pseudorhodoplanes sp.]|nr:hypothetical protein [Pseudorhodoplanes sp.]MBW7948714.1 Crp/Fnr family transcriptional regulator [Pseudorhodoplanes sp.]MCL4711250.1 Crp/Fnr family transcriptional regulator [Pseudorhodoplanes sp.]GIK81884.1 MAG: hypothetical protein BroJett024_29890 [Alphaproteobacteria bacterium]